MTFFKSTKIRIPRTNTKEIKPVLIEVPLAGRLVSSHVSRTEGAAFESCQDHALKNFFLIASLPKDINALWSAVTGV